MTLDDDDDLLTPRQAAETLNIPPSTLRELRYRGRGPQIVRIGRRCLRYRLGDLRAWVASRTEVPAMDRRSTKAKVTP
jgi:predicted DNA-binding transcriptional regulator AlpA